jgi:hypothetical protein
MSAASQIDWTDVDPDQYGNDYPQHAWTYHGQIRECSHCDEREAYWDDEEYPFNPCPANEEWKPSR